MQDFAGRTHQGHIRSHNEDCFGLDPERRLWLVADGMGGYSSGEVASAIARDTVLAEYARIPDLERAVQEAHRAIKQAVEAGVGGRGMGCTLVALALHGPHFELAWVGDARAYLWDRQLYQLSRDHSYVQGLVDRGVLHPEQVFDHPEKNLITQAVGAEGVERLSVGRVYGTLCRGQSVILCSDGLNDELRDGVISTLMTQGGSAGQRADRLLRAALDAGGRDNITVVVVDAPEDAPPSPGGPCLDARPGWQQSPGWQRPALYTLGGALTAGVFGGLFLWWLG